MEENKKKKTDGKMTVMRSILLIAIAIFFDGIQVFASFFGTSMSGLLSLIPVVGAAIGAIALGLSTMINLILSIYAVLTFFILLKLWGYKSSKVFFELCAAFVIEEIPIGNNLPFWTAWAIRHVINDYKKQAENLIPGGEALQALAA